MERRRGCAMPMAMGKSPPMSIHVLGSEANKRATSKSLALVSYLLGRFLQTIEIEIHI